uniref:Uncharacterized protein n=1 Tax=viral metagenome TaxID=1070528 RepID=A0A6C0DXM3_9ZZZZ
MRRSIKTRVNRRTVNRRTVNRRTVNRRTVKKAPKYDFDVPYPQLVEWYQSTFTKLGWMILAKKNGMMDKVLVYQNGIQRLHYALCKKIKGMHDKDKKADLLIMKENVETLQEHVKRDFS